MARYCIKTHGCKVNQCDSEMLAARLESWGVYSTTDPHSADLCIINTCTVTAVSDSKALKSIRATRRANPNAVIVVTGCLARRDPNAALSTGYVDRLIDVEHADEWFNFLTAKNAIGSERNDAQSENVPSWARRTRAFIKVQDGCDSFCSYCIVPFVRGKPRSVPVDAVVKNVAAAVESGAKEIVLTGIHLGVYGKDLDSKFNLTDLVRTVLERTAIERVRLSSIEVNEVTDELLELVASSHRLQHHFHVPLQSGDATVLRNMNRHYTGDDFRYCISRIRQMDPDLGISSDIMVGFPGETDEAFETTLGLVDELALTRLHVFKYSPRPGTAAEKLPRCVPPGIAKDRSNRMIELGRQLSEQFARRFIGRTLQILIESKRDAATGWLTGFAPNYIRAAVRNATDDMVNTIVTATVEDTGGAKAIARVTVREQQGSSDHNGVKGGMKCKGAYSAR